MQKTIKLGSIEITVQTALSIRDELKATVLTRRVMGLEPDNGTGFYDLFGELCAHTVSTKGMPFDPVSLLDGTAIDAHDAYDCFMQMGRKVKKAWTDACNEVDQVDIDLVTGTAMLSEDADPN